MDSQIPEMLFDSCITTLDEKSSVYTPCYSIREDRSVCVCQNRDQEDLSLLILKTIILIVPNPARSPIEEAKSEKSADSSNGSTSVFSFPGQPSDQRYLDLDLP